MGGEREHRIEQKGAGEGGALKRWKERAHLSSEIITLTAQAVPGGWSSAVIAWIPSLGEPGVSTICTPQTNRGAYSGAILRRSQLAN